MGLSCSPFVIIGTVLVLTQLLIFAIVINFFHTKYLEATQTSQNFAAAHIDGFKNDPRIPKPVKQKSRPQRTIDPNADGTFNGYSIYYREKKGLHTLPHCVGENYVDGVSWMYRSCKFNLFCFDTSTKDYVVFQSPEEEALYSHLEKVRQNLIPYMAL